MGKLQSSSLDRRFFHRLGASMLDRTICASAGSLGYEYTVGRGRFGADPLAVPGCKFIVNWGSNTANTNSHLWSMMIEARKAGATIVTVDPYESPTAQRSDWHIQPRPGTDAALALGLMHVIWRDGLQDDEYLNRATVGADLLRQRVATEYPPERVAAITGVDVATITTLAHRLAREQPSLIRLNYGMQRHGGGGMAVRTIACLPAIIGSWRYPGGGAMLSTSGTYDFAMDRLTRPDLSPPGTRTGQHEPTGRGAGGRTAGAAGPGSLRLQLQPGRRRPQPGQGLERTAPRGPVRRGARAVRDRHRRLRRHRAAGHVAARARRSSTARTAIST